MSVRPTNFHSEDLAQQESFLLETTVTFLKKASRFQRSIKWIFSGTGAFIAGAAPIVSKFIVEPAYQPYFVAAQVGGILMVFIGLVLTDLMTDGAPDLIRKAHYAIDQARERDSVIEELRGDFEWFTRLYSTDKALRAMVEGVLSSAAEPGQVHQLIKSMLDVVAAENNILFGMNGDRWNFAIYLWDSKSSQLYCEVCRRFLRSEEDADHRSWVPGDGHVGIAYQNRREIVASDTSRPEARALFDASPAKRKGDDRDRYRSIAAVPIIVGDGSVGGVVVGTSDVPDRFRLRDEDSKSAVDTIEPLRMLARAIALLMDMAYLRQQPVEDDHG